MFKLYEIHSDRILLTLNVFTQHSSNKSRLYIVLYLLTHSKQVPVRLSHFLCLLPLVFICFFFLTKNQLSAFWVQTAYTQHLLLTCYFMAEYVLYVKCNFCGPKRN